MLARAAYDLQSRLRNVLTEGLLHALVDLVDVLVPWRNRFPDAREKVE